MTDLQDGKYGVQLRIASGQVKEGYILAQNLRHPFLEGEQVVMLDGHQNWNGVVRARQADGTYSVQIANDGTQVSSPAQNLRPAQNLYRLVTIHAQNLRRGPQSFLKGEQVVTFGSNPIRNGVVNTDPLADGRYGVQFSMDSGEMREEYISPQNLSRSPSNNLSLIHI